MEAPRWSHFFNMQNLFIVPLEPIETRYTKHWYTEIPRLLKKELGSHFNISQLEVEWTPTENTPGAFLNFSATMGYKARQLDRIASMFSAEEVSDNDVFLFTDYWNPNVNSLRYMSELSGIPVKIFGICHAGKWDPADILGQRFADSNWMSLVELSLDEVYDGKFFATEFSRSLYEESYSFSENNLVTGFPMEYYDSVMTPYWELKSRPEKDNIICFPHRKSPEKGLDIFQSLAKMLPDYEFVISMDVCKTKEDYHDLLYKSKMCFSASSQETLGISMGLESLRAGCDVMVPDKLSYSELFFANFKYNPDLITNISRLAETVDMRMKRPNHPSKIVRQHNMNYQHYFTGTRMYSAIRRLAKEAENETPNF